MKQMIWIVLAAAGLGLAMPDESLPMPASSSPVSDENTPMTDGRGSTMVHYGNCTSVSTPNGSFLTSGC